MSTVSVRTRIDEAALKKADPTKTKPPKPDLSFLDKPIWEMNNAEMFARVEIEGIAARMARLVMNFTDEKAMSDLAVSREILWLQWRIRRIVQNAAKLEGELEDENGIAQSSHQ